MRKSTTKTKLWSKTPPGSPGSNSSPVVGSSTFNSVFLSPGKGVRFSDVDAPRALIGSDSEPSSRETTPLQKPSITHQSYASVVKGPSVPPKTKITWASVVQKTGISDETLYKTDHIVQTERMMALSLGSPNVDTKQAVARVRVLSAHKVSSDTSCKTLLFTDQAKPRAEEYFEQLASQPASANSSYDSMLPFKMDL